MIKKLGITLIIVLMLAPFSLAKKIHFGLSIGTSSSRISERMDYQEMVKSTCGGFVIDYSLGKKLSLHSGVLYFKKGASGLLHSWGNLHVLTDVQTQIEFLKFPLMLKIHFFPHVYIGHGPYFALKTAGELYVWGEDRSYWLNQEDIGYIFMTGIDFKFLHKKHFIEIRYCRGFTNAVSIHKHVTVALLYGIYFN